MTTKQRVAYVIATWFGCGYSPWAPGTAGSLGTVPLHVALCFLPSWLHWCVVAVLSLLGIWSGGVVAAHRGDDDPSLVVIDEVAGTLIAMGAVRTASWPIQLLAFALFRLLDITKPPPIRQAEHANPAGLGIMLDDLLAGLGAGAIAWWLSNRGWLPF
jgi:phosphatidylglycerophosphatase A